MSAQTKTAALHLQAPLVALVKASLLRETRGDLAQQFDVEAARQQGLLTDIATAKALDLDGIWASAVEEATSDEALFEQANVSVSLQPHCPISWEMVLGPLNFTGIALAIRSSAATG